MVRAQADSMITHEWSLVWEFYDASGELIGTGADPGSPPPGAMRVRPLIRVPAAAATRSYYIDPGPAGTGTGPDG